MSEAYSTVAETGASQTRKPMIMSHDVGTSEAVVALNYHRNFLFYNYRLRKRERYGFRHRDSNRLRDMYRDWVRDRDLHRDTDWIRYGLVNRIRYRFLHRDWVRLRDVNGVGSVYRDGHWYLNRDRDFLFNSDWIRLWNWNFDFLGNCDGLHFTMAP
jgi:hypothetical protein